MASALWGNVYYHNTFAGILRNDGVDRYSFTYDIAYLNSGLPAIAHTLPLQEVSHVSENGLHAFFDNLIAEGWLESAQTRSLGKRNISRFELLLAFGFDCIGAVSILDPESSMLSSAMLDVNDQKEMAAFTSRASLSGVQPKLALIKLDNEFIPAPANTLSTHFAKFISQGHDDLIANEYLTTQAFKALLPNDAVVHLSIGVVKGISESALIIERFDRENGVRIHFEEFNQLLNLKSQLKYEGAYQDMSNWMTKIQSGKITDIYRLYVRILAGFLLGNTDMHFKNFAMFHSPEGFYLTPSYDQVAAALYDYQSIALGIGGVKDFRISRLQAKHLVRLGHEFLLSDVFIDMAVKQLAARLNSAKDVIAENAFGSQVLKNKLIAMMEKRWNGAFALIGKVLSKQP